MPETTPFRPDRRTVDSRHGHDGEAVPNPVDARLDGATLRWINDRVGGVIDALDGADFYPRLTGFLRQIADCDSVVALAYHRDRAPTVRFENLAPRDRESLYGPYFDGAYLLSPFYLRWQENHDSASLFRLREIAPDGFFVSTYYTDYYLGSGLRDEVAYLVPIDFASGILLSLGRTAKLTRYSAVELDLLAAVQGLVSNCVKQHALLVGDAGGGRLSRQLSAQLTNFGDGILTEQEKRVAALLLRGHSSKSCARELAISPTTERVHRRNIYAKLKISSQAELFALFFDSLSIDAESPKMKLAGR